MDSFLTKTLGIAFFLGTILLYSYPLSSMLRGFQAFTAGKRRYLFFFSALLLLTFFLALRSLNYSYTFMVHQFRAD